MLARIIAAITIISFVLLVWTLNSTNPAEAGPVGILAVFVFMYMSLIGLATFLIYYGSRLMARIFSYLSLNGFVNRVTSKKAYYYSTVVALAPMMLLGLHSVGRVTWYEISLVLLFIIIGCLYVSKRT